MSRSSQPSNFRAKLDSDKPLIGSFIKIPTPHASEMLGLLGFDFVVIDEEHGPIGKDSLDSMLLATRASGIAGVVRVPSPDPSHILGCLDMGAEGILVPHIDTREKAEAMVAACRYAAGKRGFSNTTRAGRYGGTTFAEHIEQQDAGIAAIAMIEDPSALDHLDEIMTTPGLDAVFIGRGDLAVASGETSMSAAVVVEATDRIMETARSHNLPVIVTAGGAKEIAEMSDRGASGFIVASDQGFLRQAASGAIAGFRDWKNEKYGDR